MSAKGIRVMPVVGCLRERKAKVLVNRYLVFSLDLGEAPLSKGWLKDADIVVCLPVLELVTLDNQLFRISQPQSGCKEHCLSCCHVVLTQMRIAVTQREISWFKHTVSWICFPWIIAPCEFTTNIHMDSCTWTWLSFFMSLLLSIAVFTACVLNVKHTALSTPFLMLYFHHSTPHHCICIFGSCLSLSSIILI